MEKHSSYSSRNSTKRKLMKKSSSSSANKSRKNISSSRASSSRAVKRAESQKKSRKIEFLLRRTGNVSMDVDMLVNKMNYIEMEVDDGRNEPLPIPEIRSLTLQNSINNSRSALWYNYRIGMNPGYYVPLFSLSQYNKDNTFPIIDFFSNLAPPENNITSYTRRFCEIFFEKNTDGSIQVNILNTNTRRYQSVRLDTDVQMYYIEKKGGKKIVQDIYYFLFEQIRELNLFETIMNTMNNGKKLFIAVDFYFNRNSNIGFHKDTIPTDSETLYVALTYNNEYSMLGPDIIAYPSNPIYRASPVKDSARKHKKLEVFRTLIPPYGRIGFNDQIFAHSSPYENNELFTDSGIEICSDISNMCQRVKLQKSPYRGTMIDRTARTFLRTWWYHYKTENDEIIRSNIFSTQKIDFDKFAYLCSPMPDVAQYVYDYKMITKDLFNGIVHDLNSEMMNLG